MRGPHSSMDYQKWGSHYVWSQKRPESDPPKLTSLSISGQVLESPSLLGKFDADIVTSDMATITKFTYMTLYVVIPQQ